MGIVNKILKVFVGDKSEKDVKSLRPLVEAVKEAEKELENFDLDGLRTQSANFKKEIKEATASITEEINALEQQIEVTEDIDAREALYQEIDTLEGSKIEKEQEVLNDLLPKAFALVRETAKRFKENQNLSVSASIFDRELSARKEYVTIEGEQAIWKNSWNAAGKEVVWDMVHYDVQLIGGIVLHQGKIAEMQTGEGKTLVATLPVFLNALTGRGVHLVTVNDYLAKRDSQWMAPIFEFHGLSVDCIDLHQPNSAERKAAYTADITYGTNNEFGFDYLRDNMAHQPTDLVQRKPHYAIVDEVDSVLVDDARTPLIISGPVPEGERHEFDALRPVVADLVQQQRSYLTNLLVEAKKLIQSGETTLGGFKLLQVHRGLPKNKALIKFLSEEGVKQLLQKTESLYLQDNGKEMAKVDADLWFTIDEKTNQIELTEKGIQTLSTGQDEHFFILPDIGSEIAKIESAGLSIEEEADRKKVLFSDFSVKSERIHTLTQLLKAYTLFEKDVEYVVIDNKVKIVDEQTGRIMEGRRYSDGLHQAIEAKEKVKIEALTQTFATVTLQNYFRMYHKLSGMTGTAVTEAGEFWEIYQLDVVEIPTHRPIAREDRDDLIYKTKREKYNAIIEEVIKLSEQKRPVLIGTTSVEISELLSKLLSVRKIKHNVLNAKLHQKEADIVAEAGNPGVVTIATNMAGRGTDIKLSEEVKQSGGLAIIGTERHDSRRVDRQLRGRSGRQGDPGSSQFYVSLEDNLMRLFGSERMAKIMDRMGLEEGEVIQHSMMTKSIERAQKKVEENNFGIRKRLLEYDDVMNAQREVIYKRRKHALFGERLKVDIANMIFDTAESIVEQAKNSSDYKQFSYDCIQVFGIIEAISETEFDKGSITELSQKLYQKAFKAYNDQLARSANQAFPVIEEVFKNPNNQFKRIVVPFTDGNRTLQIITDLEKAFESKGKSLISDFEKNIALALIDEAWKNHLRKMDELKQSVQLAVHEQKDPLLIYKFEAFELFRTMIDSVNRDLISFLFKAGIPTKSPEGVRDASKVQQPKREKLNLSKEEVLNSDELASQNRAAGASATRTSPKVETVVRQQPKIGRNEKVIILNPLSGEEKEVKFKQAEPLLKSGQWVLKS